MRMLLKVFAIWMFILEGLYFLDDFDRLLG